jgi:SAM-dependent methyltransferase
MTPGWHNLDGGIDFPNPFWLTVDTRVAFPDGSLEVVFSEHFFEHLDLPVARHFVRESARVLRKGGVFRVSCPDLDVIAGYVTNKNDDWRQLAAYYEGSGDPPEGCSRPDMVVNWAFYGNHHKHLWNLAALTDELTRAGFSDVRRMPHGVSRIEGAAVEVRVTEQFYSLIAEATRS